jgi:hypothetical protein
MKSKGLFLVTIVLFFINCTPSNNGAPVDEGLIGEWTLINYSAGFSEPLILEPGDIIWDFQKKGNLKVTINPSLNNNPQLESGEYLYTFGDSKIYIKKVSYDYEIIDNKLLIGDKPEADGPLLQFSLYQ